MSDLQLFAAPMGGITGANMQRVEGIKNIQYSYNDKVRYPKMKTLVQRHNDAIKEKAKRIRPADDTRVSGRQQRIVRKTAQQEGTDAFVHTKPRARSLAPIPLRPGKLGWEVNNRALKRRERLYGKPEVA